MDNGSVLELAQGLARIVKEDKPGRVAPLDLTRAEARYEIKKPPHLTGLKEKTELVRRADETAWAQDKRIRQVKALYLERGQEVFIANSEGLGVEDARTGVILLAQGGGRGRRGSSRPATSLLAGPWGWSCSTITRPRRSPPRRPGGPS